MVRDAERGQETCRLSVARDALLMISGGNVVSWCSLLLSFHSRLGCEGSAQKVELGLPEMIE